MENKNTNQPPENKIYATLDADGLPSAFFSTEIHQEIPEDALLIDEDTWREYIEHPHRRQFKNGKIKHYERIPSDDEKKEALYLRLTQAVSKRREEIKTLIVDKKGSKQYIQAQYEIYEELYASAKNGLFSQEENTQIVTANKKAKSDTAAMTLALNRIRRVLMKGIELGSEIEESLMLFENTSFSKDFFEQKTVNKYVKKILEIS